MKATMALDADATPVASTILLSVPPLAVADHKRVVVWFPSFYLNSGGECLSDYTNAIHHARQSVMLLVVLAHLASHPVLCTSDGTKKESEISDADKQLYFTSTPVGDTPVNANGQQIIETAERIVTHLEVVRAADGEGICGLRFWIDVQDTRINLDRGLETLIIKNHEDIERYAKRGQVPPVPPLGDIHRAVVSRAVWIDSFLAAQSLVRDKGIVLKPLYDTSDHTASVYDRLSPERAVSGMHHPENAFHSQRHEGNYIVPHPSGAGHVIVWPRPNDTYRLGPRNFNPIALLTCRLPHLGPAPGSAASLLLAQRLLSPDQLAAEALLAQEHSLTFGVPPPDPNSNAMDKLAECAKLVQTRIDLEVSALGEIGLDGADPQYERQRRLVEWGSSRSSIDEFEQALYGGSACAKVCDAADWLRARQTASADGSLRLLSKTRRPIDPSLSHFGNFAAHFANDLEQHCSVKSVHSTTVMCWYACQTASEMSEDLKVNVLLTGPPAAGKSYVMYLLQHRLLPNFMIDCTSRFTKRGFETETDKMHCVFMFDEIDPEILGMDKFGRTVGTGDPIIKELMTNQKVTVRVFETDANRKRITVTCVSRMPCQIMGGTNNDGEAVAGPIKSRMVIRKCPEIDRPNHDIQEKEFARAHKMDGSASAGRQAHDIDERYQKLAVLKLIVEQMIYTKRLRGPSMHTAKIHIMRMCSYLETQGIDANRMQRVALQVEKLARTATIISALDIVFNTDAVFSDRHKVFEMKDLLKVDLFMQCTEEIVWFCFQLLGDQFVDVEDARPVVALAKKEAHYKAGMKTTDAPDSATIFATATGGSSTVQEAAAGTTLDYDYIVIKGIHAEKNMTHQRAVAIKMASAMTRGQFTTSLENLEGIVQTLSEGKMSAVPFAGPGLEKMPPGTPQRCFPHLEINVQASTCRISRHWLEKVVTVEYANVMMGALRHCLHAHTVTRRVVCGMTYITDPDAGVGNPPAADYVMAPHMWRVLKVEPNPALILRVANTQGFDFGAAGGLAATSEPGVFEAAEDLEKTEFRRRVRLCCVPADDMEAATECLPHRLRERLWDEFGRRQGSGTGQYPITVRHQYVLGERAKILALRGGVVSGGSTSTSTTTTSTNGNFIAPLSSATRPRDDDLENILTRKRPRLI